MERIVNIFGFARELEERFLHKGPLRAALESSSRPEALNLETFDLLRDSFR